MECQEAGWFVTTTMANEESDDPIMMGGPNGTLCEWERTNDTAWNAEWLGSGCGVSLTAVALPRMKNESIGLFWDFRDHQDANLCYTGDSTNVTDYTIVEHEVLVCPDDHTQVIWSSFMTVDKVSNNATAISCGNGTVAVWSRRDYDEMEDAEFISDYFGPVRWHRQSSLISGPMS